MHISSSLVGYFRDSCVQCEAILVILSLLGSKRFAQKYWNFSQHTSHRRRVVVIPFRSLVDNLLPMRNLSVKIFAINLSIVSETSRRTIATSLSSVCVRWWNTRDAACVYRNQSHWRMSPRYTGSWAIHRNYDSWLVILCVGNVDRTRRCSRLRSPTALRSTVPA